MVTMERPTKTWSRVPISSAYAGLYDGPHATPKPSAEGPVFLGIGNITEDGHLDLSTIRHIAEEDFPKWTRRVEPRPGDIVFVYEAALNRYAIIPEGFRGCLGRRLALIRPDPEKALGRFLFYYFFSEDWRRTIAKNTLSGATVDRIPLTTFPTFELGLPSLKTQEKITALLSPYDDLIENNTRRIAILEEMARSLYCEWFVNLRFPGHESVELVESPLGPIPVDWRVAPLSTVADVIDCLHSKKPDVYENGNGILLQLFNIGDGGKVDLSQTYRISDDDYIQWISRIEAQEGDCVITNVGRIAAVAQIPPSVKAALGRNMTAVRPKPGVLAPTFLIEYLLSPHMKNEVQQKKDAGAVMDSLNVRSIVKLQVPMPPAELMDAFENLARPMRRRVELLVQQNHTLHTTRDLLLPRLISGELDVCDLDIDVGDLSA